MSEQHYSRDVTSMWLMTRLGVDHGLSVQACLAGTGLREQDLSNPAVVASAAQELRLIGNLVGQLGHIPGIGIEAGRRYHLTAFGALGFAMVSSPNARSALELALRYFQLTFAFTRFHVEEQGDETHITLEDTGLPEAIRAFVVERDAAALVTVQRDLFSQRPGLKGLCFAFRAPADIARHEQFFGMRPAFGAGANTVVMSTAALMEPLSQSNELAQRAAEDQCRLLLERQRSRDGVAARVRTHLARHGAYMPGMEAVAGELCITPRTLRRWLHDEGTTFLSLRDEVRRALAEELLTGLACSVEQVAERLGYAEPTCFINAFKRWTGTTPLVYRKNVRVARAAWRGAECG